VSLINTINSVIGVDLDQMLMSPHTGSQGSRRLLRPGGEADCAEYGLGNWPRRADPWLPISGIGGIGTWRDAAEFIALGCATVQVCTAAMVMASRLCAT
jgi:dihydropyrimidine dehydrogenase (NAD+) subunit PreA